jgi:hypothetical protein
VIGAEPHLHGPLLQQWLHEERAWVLDFCWPSGYDPVAED